MTKWKDNLDTETEEQTANFEDVKSWLKESTDSFEEQQQRFGKVESQLDEEFEKEAKTKDATIKELMDKLQWLRSGFKEEKAKLFKLEDEYELVLDSRVKEDVSI